MAEIINFIMENKDNIEDYSFISLSDESKIVTFDMKDGSFISFDY